MNNFKKGGFGHGGDASSWRPKFGGDKKFGGKFGGARDGGDRSERHMELFPAVCSECKKNCEVPFRPSRDKPVYCRDCFRRQDQAPRRNFSGSDRSGGDFRRDDRPQREYKPEYPRAQSDGGIDALKRQIAALELKVNRILEIVSQQTKKPAFSAPIVEEIPKVVKEGF